MTNEVPKETLADYVLKFSQIEHELALSKGELSPTLEAMSLDLTGKIEEKIEGYHAVIGKLEHTTEYYEQQAEKYAKVAKGLKQGAQFLKHNLHAAMEAMDTKEVLAGSVRAKIVKCAQRLVITSPDLVPDSFRIVESTPDTVRIKQVLEKGDEIPGCSLAGGTALRFYPNREVKK